MRICRLLIAGVLSLGLIGLAAGCGDEAVTGTDGPAPEPVADHPAVTLMVSPETAGPGETVTVAARVDTGTVDPTGFVAELRFDPAALTPREALDAGTGAMTLVHLDAGEGRVRAAAAAADGLADPTLFGVRMTVEEADYLAGLRLTVEELNVLEEGKLREVSARLPPTVEPSVRAEPHPLDRLVDTMKETLQQGP